MIGRRRKGWSLTRRRSLPLGAQAIVAPQATIRKRMTGFAFRSVPPEPDHPELERRVLERWERERTFERVREARAGGETFSFFDGPITANNPMGVHHAWGRSLKDLFQRYQAALGKDLRYQNGFDCQGLWVEVEVEKALGLNSKRDIETYGLDASCAPAATASPSTPACRRASRSASACGWTGSGRTSR